MKNSAGKFILIGCSGIGLVLLFIAGAALWLVFGVVESVNNNMTRDYFVKGDKVNYYTGLSGYGAPRSWEIKEADAATFKVIGQGYATDKNCAYLDGFKIPQSSGTTFKIIQKPYSADQDHVFYESFSLSNSPAKFKFIFQDKKENLATDGEKVFYKANALFPETLDAETFEPIGATDYFKDKTRVYTLEKIVEGADPETFEVVPDHKGTYAKDKKSVFYNGIKVEGCDPRTHKIIGFSAHRDARHVFLGEVKVSDDPENFRVLEANYFKDEKNVYWKSKTVGADPATFEVFPSTYGTAFARDEKNVYWCDKKFDRADAATFVGLNGHYGKDKNYVWYADDPNAQPDLVENADTVTFEFDGGGDQARDKNSYFEFGKFKSKRFLK